VPENYGYEPPLAERLSTAEKTAITLRFMQVRKGFEILQGVASIHGDLSEQGRMTPEASQKLQMAAMVGMALVMPDKFGIDIS